MVAKPVGRPTGGFPRFKDGDVVVDLGMLGELTYRLHSSTLSQVSPWFNDTLKYTVQEADNRFASSYTKRTGIRARYELSYNADLNILVLGRTVSSVLMGGSWSPTQVFVELCKIFGVADVLADHDKGPHPRGASCDDLNRSFYRRSSNIRNLTYHFPATELEHNAECSNGY